jgi:hypothetical protein
MYEDICKSCGKELFIGKILEHSYEYWCPFCLGLSPLEINEAIRICEKYSKEIRGKALMSAQAFSKNDLLVPALITREMEAIKVKRGENNRIQYILWSSLIIRDCFKGNHSISSAKLPTAENMHELFLFYDSVIASENLFVKVKEGYFYIFEVNSEIILRIKDLKVLHETIEVEGKNYMAFPAQQWRYYSEMAQTINMCPDTRFKQIKNNVNSKWEALQKEENELKSQIMIARGKKKTKLERKLLNIQKLSTAEFIESCYNSFHASYYNKDFFSFEDISKNTTIFDFFDLITKISANQIEILSKQLGEEQIVYRIEISKFKSICELKGLDFTEIRKVLIFSEDNCEGFPLFVEYKNEILICPDTLFIFSNLIKFSIDKESYKSDSYSLGDDFEKEIKTIFESYSYSLSDPLNKNKKLIRRKIKFKKEGKMVKREIDLLPYNDKLLFVVECKRNSFKPGYIFKSDRQDRISSNGGIKDEINNKHIDRVTYFYNKQNEFGFKNHRKVKGLIITLIKEDIEHYMDIDIVPLCDLGMYLKNIYQ